MQSGRNFFIGISPRYLMVIKSMFIIHLDKFLPLTEHSSGADKEPKMYNSQSFAFNKSKQKLKLKLPSPW
jgi:hypothetical protein